MELEEYEVALIIQSISKSIVRLNRNPTNYNLVKKFEKIKETLSKYIPVENYLQKKGNVYRIKEVI